MKTAFLSLMLFLAPWAVNAADNEPVLEVDLPAAPEATATPTAVPTATPQPTATATPQPAPAEAEAQAEATPSPTAGQDLGKVRFDGGADGDGGLMIISPGAASPEDSLESFGIDSPFDWKRRGRPTLQPGADDGEALELNAPETSDLRERVQVENGEGEALPGDGDFDKIEAAGTVLSASEYRMDGRILRTTDGQYFARVGNTVALRMEPGRQIYPGSIYTSFRDGGVLRASGPDARDVGMLEVNTGVLRVVRIEGEEVLARVEKQYTTIREGDMVRLRDPDRLRYYNSLRQGGTPPAELKGEVIGMRPTKLLAKRGDVVYLDVGRRLGASPGQRLQIVRQPRPTDIDENRTVIQTGRVGLAEIINVNREASTAIVIQAEGEIRVGDKVRFR